jgi:hypothetical protein
MNGVGKPHYFRHSEADRHYKGRKEGRPGVFVERPQPQKQAQGEYRDSEDRKKLLVKDTVTVEHLVPDSQQQVKGIKYLGERICIKRKTSRLGGRPQRQMEIGETRQQIDFVPVI